MKNGARFRKPLKTRNLAKAYKLLADLETTDYKEPKRLSDAIATFLGSRKDVAHGTLRNDKRILRHFEACCSELEIKNVNEIEVETVDHYYRSPSNKAFDVDQRACNPSPFSRILYRPGLDKQKPGEARQAAAQDQTITSGALHK